MGGILVEYVSSIGFAEYIVDQLDKELKESR